MDCVNNQISILDFVSYYRNEDPYRIYLHEFLWETGIRPSEIFRISNRHLLYRDGKVIYEQPKTGFIREFKISDMLLKKTRYFHQKRGNFSTNLKNYNFMKRFLCNRVGFLYKHLCPHQKLYYFRYLFVLTQLTLDKSILEISYSLGHQETSSTMLYIETAEKINQALQRRRKKNG